MSNREGIEHFSHKAMLRKHLETGFNHQGGIWFATNEVNCRSCDGGLIPVNILEGVTRVGEVEAPFRYGSWDFIPDIMLWGANERKPLAFVEVVHTSAPSPEKVAFCQREGIDLFTFDARAPIRNHFETRLLWGESSTLRCRRRLRNRLKQLMGQLYSLPADAAKVGVSNQWRDGQLLPVQTYWVGNQTVNRSELMAVACLHAMMMQWEANDRIKASDLEHDDDVPYTRREKMLDTEVKNVVTAVQWENILPGEKPHSGKPSRASRDAWLFPKNYWDAPEPPPLWGITQNVR